MMAIPPRLSMRRCCKERYMFKQKGLSLIELMVSLVIGLILMTGVVEMFMSSKGTFTTQNAMSRVQEAGRLAIDFMAKDIRQAGYAGCISRGEMDVVNGLDSSANGDYRYEMETAVRGYDAATAENTLDVTDGLTNIDVKANTDVLLVSSAGTSSLNITQNTGNSANLRVSGDVAGECVGDVCIGDVVVLSDCVQARRFQITNLTTISGGGTVNVVHSNSNAVSPGNASPNWDQQFDSGSQIVRTTTMAYFIANNTEGEPSLYQKVGDETPVVLLAGVEDMRLTYSSNGGSYVEDSSVSNWNAVTSVHVELLVRSPIDNVVDDPQPYTFAGTTTTPSDRRIRQTFNSTVAIRNRLQ